MNLDLSPEQQAFVDSLVASGRFPSVHEAISEGIRLLVSHERLRREVQIGIDQAGRGEVRDHETVFAHLRTMTSAAEEAENG